MNKKHFVLSIILCLLPIMAHATIYPGWVKHVIGPMPQTTYLYVKDLDRDGDLDVATASNLHPGVNPSEVAWFRNNNQGASWDKFIISALDAPDPINNAYGVIISDIDGDGREDVVVATGRALNQRYGCMYWFKAPPDPTGVWQRFDVEVAAPDSYAKVYTMDANHDGMQDIIVGGQVGAVLYLNPGNPGQPGAVWEKIPLPQGTGAAIYLDDLNGDGRTDVISAYRGDLQHDYEGSNVSWVDVNYTGGHIVLTNTIVDPELPESMDANCMDVNEDGRKDVVVTVIHKEGDVPFGALYWYEAPADFISPWTKHTVSDSFMGADIYTGDIDRNGKIDIAESGISERKVVWWSYTNQGDQIVWTQHIIDDDIYDPGDISLNDVDEDGDLDVVLAGYGEAQVIWYENTLPPPTTTTTTAAVTTTTTTTAPPTTTTTTAPPTLVTLQSFEAQPGNRSVQLTWYTAGEVNNAGFNIYRAESENGTYQKINDSLIAATGAPVRGASYEFVDKDIRYGITYYYKLEDLDFTGTATFHGPVSATPRIMAPKFR